MSAERFPTPLAKAGPPAWIHVGTMLDGTSTTPATDVHVVYDAEGIRFVGRDGRTPPAEMLRPGQTTPDLADLAATILPGLIEAHAHLFLEGGELDPGKRAEYLKRTPAELFGAAWPRMEKLARLGIAGIRDAGDKDGVGLALSAVQKRVYGIVAGGGDAGRPDPSSRGVKPLPPGSPAGAGGGPHPNPVIPSSGPRTSEAKVGGALRPELWPYLDSPGAAIHRRGRYGSFMGGALEDYPTPADCVAARIAAGADRIKLIPTGIINFKAGAVTTPPQMSVENLRQLVAAAQAGGLQTFAHASGDEGIERAIEAGVDSVEHGFFIRDDQLARMRDRQIAWVPTFAPVQLQMEEAARYGWDAAVVANLQEILQMHAARLRLAHGIGVLVIAGSDAGSCGVPHGLGLLREMELMEAAGMPALAVINAATGTPAQRLGFARKFGRIEPGWLSRFIVTRHPPHESVRNLSKPRMVVFDGAVFETGKDFDDTGL